VSKQQKTLVYVTRRGLYPVLVCQDCRHTNYTKNFREQIQRYQIASNLQEWSDPNTTEEWLDRCEECGSWRLHPLAITLKQTEIALRELLGEDHNISVVDTVTDTPAQSRKTIKNFNNGDSTILLTTQRGLYLQTKPVPNSIIVSVDAALSSSSLNVETSIIRLLEHAKYLTTQNLFLQTRLEDNRVLNTFINQTYRKLQIQNLREREKMNFPPFSTQIKLTLPVDHNLPYEQNLKSLLKKLNSNLVILPGLDNYKVCLITVPRPIWHDDQSLPLKNYLFNLHNKYSIRINPDILL
jgi:primosomal protein N' (replication factor Y)